MEDVKKTTLWDVLADKRIVVPVIQRDYAQGRDTQFAKNVRECFVERLYEAVREENGNPLCMDFVYFEKDGDKLIPVDGQQRLTTLWLFHVYHLTKENKVENKENKEENKKITKRLEQFTYEVRQTSKAFCKQLVEQRFEWFKALCKCEREECVCEKVICNQPWFFTAWRRDPTIMGMIRMLDTIHAKDDGTKLVPKWWEKGLKGPLTFLDYTTQEKDLYCKMNARGKLLTPFENLKAAIDERAPDDSTWKSAVDGTWLNKVWEIVGNKGCDRAMFRLTLTLLLLHYIERDDETATEKASLIENVRKTIKDPDVTLPTNDWERLMDVNSVSFLEKGFSRLVCSSTKKECEQEEKPWYPEDINTWWRPIWCTWWRPIWKEYEKAQSKNLVLTALANKSTESAPLSYREECLVYAYILAKSEPSKLKIEPRDWWRIVHNILENQGTRENQGIRGPKDLVDTLRRIQALHDKCDLDDMCVSSSQETFAEVQCKEEAEKLKLLNKKNENWRAPIEEAEALLWQKGRINFLLERNKKRTPQGLDEERKELAKDLGEAASGTRVAWLRRAVANIEKEWKEKWDEQEKKPQVWIPCRVGVNDDALKGFLYGNNNDDLTWQRSVVFDGKAESDTSDWVCRLDSAYQGWEKVADERYEIWNTGKCGYLFTTKNITSAICIDDSVQWWYDLYTFLERGSDWVWNWKTHDSGSVIEVEEVRFAKEDEPRKFRLIQTKTESIVKVSDWESWQPAAGVKLDDTSPENVVKVMKALAKEFPMKRKKA